MDVTVVYIWTNSPPPLSVDQRNAGAHDVNLFEWGRRGYRYCLKGLAMLLWKFPPYLLLSLPLHPTTLWKCCGMKWLLLCYNLYYMVVIRPVFSAWYYSISVFSSAFSIWIDVCSVKEVYHFAKLEFHTVVCVVVVLSFVCGDICVHSVFTYIHTTVRYCMLSLVAVLPYVHYYSMRRKCFVRDNTL